MLRQWMANRTPTGVTAGDRIVCFYDPGDAPLPGDRESDVIDRWVADLNPRSDAEREALTALLYRNPTGWSVHSDQEVVNGWQHMRQAVARASGTCETED